MLFFTFIPYDILYRPKFFDKDDSMLGLCAIMDVDFFFSVNEAHGKRSIHSFITRDKLSFEKLDVE